VFKKCKNVVYNITAMKHIKRDVVQVKNPKSGHYVKIDRSAGKILEHKSSLGPYKGIPVARKTHSR